MMGMEWGRPEHFPGAKAVGLLFCNTVKPLSQWVIFSLLLSE